MTCRAKQRGGPEREAQTATPEMTMVTPQELCLKRQVCPEVPVVHPRASSAKTPAQKSKLAHSAGKTLLPGGKYVTIKRNRSKKTGQDQIGEDA